VQAVRRSAPARVVVAVPVGAPSACAQVAALADEIVCAQAPDSFSAVGEWYRDFAQTSDDEVRQLLAAAQRRPGGGNGKLENPHDLVDAPQQTVRPADSVR
jgi:predicted phosphoribosyltransferase